jgi:molybdopterin converting factor subunit 1
MNLKVLFFAQCADWMQRREMEIPLDGPVRLMDLIRKTPELTPVLEHLNVLKVAVNQEIADIDLEVKSGDEVAFLPPLSGG